MISRSFILLAIIAISIVQVAFARLRNNHAHDPVLSTRRAKQIRKAHNTRKLLANATRKIIADKLGIVEHIFQEAMS